MTHILTREYIEGEQRAMSDTPRTDALVARYSPDWPNVAAEALAEHARRLERALQDVADPIEYLRRTMPPDCALNGLAAVQFADNANNLRKIARDALDSLNGGGTSK